MALEKKVQKYKQILCKVNRKQANLQEGIGDIWAKAKANSALAREPAPAPQRTLLEVRALEER